METAVTAAPRSPLSKLSALAGIVFSLSWFIGLSVWSASAEVTRTGEALLRHYSGHETRALVQFFFTEGLPALTLALVMAGLASRVRASGESLLGRVILASGLAAATISLIQFLLGAFVCLVSVPAQDAAATKTAIDVLSRIDGVKMLIMTAFAFAAFRAIRTGKTGLPRWLAWVAAALAVTIFLSGVGFLFLLDGLSIAAYASLPLLMVWVTSVGLLVGRK